MTSPSEHHTPEDYIEATKRANERAEHDAVKAFHSDKADRRLVADYKLIGAERPVELNDKVRTAIEEGFQPHGEPMIIVSPAGDFVYHQVMVKLL